MKAIAVFLAAAAFAGAAHADTAQDMVASLVTKLCMPAVETLTAPEKLPEGAVVMNADAKKKMGMDPRSTAWIYTASNDKVVLEMGIGGCNVIAQNTGDESYLKALETALGETYPNTYVDTDDATGGGLRWRNYVVPLAKPNAIGMRSEALSVTYSTADTPAGGKMFFVAVLESQKK